MLVWMACVALAILVMRLSDRVGQLDYQLRLLQQQLQSLQARLAQDQPAAPTPPESAAVAVPPEDRVFSPSPEASPAAPFPSGTDAPVLLPTPRSMTPTDWATAAADQSPVVLPPQGMTRPTADPGAKRSPESMGPADQALIQQTSLLGSVLGWFGGGNLIVRLGILVLLVGVVFLLRLAVQAFAIPIELRLALVALGGLGLTGLGLWLQARRRGYALTLQGGGVVVLYLTVFAALRIFPVLPPTLAFVLLVGLAALSALLAVWQDALALALLAFGGAYAAPLLTSTGQGNALMLFSYLLLINTALAWVAHRRTWRALNGLGALFTFGLAAFWGWNQFNPQWRWPLEGLLLAHMLLYWFIAVRYTQQLGAVVEALPVQRQQQVLRRVPLVDGGLLFGVPLLGFGLQAALIRDIPHALALSSAGWALVYLLTGVWLVRRTSSLQGRGVRLLSEGALALGSGFVALVLPLAIDPHWTALGWSVQGAGMVWLGQRQGRRWSVWLGLLLQLGSLLALLWLMVSHGGVVLMPQMVLALMLWGSAYWLRAGAGLAHWGLLLRYGVLGFAGLISLWFGQTLLEHHGGEAWTGLGDAEQLSWLLLALGSGVMLVLRWRPWAELLQTSRLAVPGTALVLLSATAASATLSVLGVGAWLALWLLQLQQLAQQDQYSRRDQAVGLGLSVLLLALLPASALSVTAPGWEPLLALWLPLLWLGAVLWKKHLPARWLDARQVQDDLLVPLMGGWLLWLCWSSLVADVTRVGGWYVPVLSLVDVSTALAMGLWWQLQRQSPHWHRGVPAVLALSGWLWLTGMINRSVHVWASVPLLLDGGWQAGGLQSSLTLGWSVLAAVLMVLGHRRQQREIWLGGAALLAVVLLKLLLVDLSNVTALARVVSFMGAGGLMLLIGYLAPLPPARTAVQSADAVEKAGPADD